MSSCSSHLPAWYIGRQRAHQQRGTSGDFANRHYSFSGRQRAHRQQGTTTEFANLEEVLSVVGNMPIDSEASVVTSSISKKVCQLSKVLIRIGLRACVRRGECAYVFLSVWRLYCMIRKKKTIVPEASSGTDHPAPSSFTWIMWQSHTGTKLFSISKVSVFVDFLEELLTYLGFIILRWSRSPGITRFVCWLKIAALLFDIPGKRIVAMKKTRIQINRPSVSASNWF